MSARGNPGETGFTLVELMVVLVIVGLASAMVLFAMPDPRGNLRDEGVRLAARVRAAQDLAITGSRPVALVVRGDGYAFERRERGRWTAPDEPALEGRAWGRDVVASVAAGEARTILDPTGTVDPLSVRLARDGRVVIVTVAADGAVDVAG